MEMENLMANDLVYYNGKPVRLKDLWQDFLRNLQTKDNENHQDKHVVWDFGSDKISPIEISEDILLKSNFKRSSSYEDVYYSYSKEDSEHYYSIKITPRKNQWVISAERFNIGENSKYFLRQFDGNIKYIHELQHILRLTGIEKEVKI